jgi:hypothetical protein
VSNNCFSKPTDFCNVYGICLFKVGTEFHLLDLCFKELLDKNFIKHLQTLAGLLISIAKYFK